MSMVEATAFLHGQLKKCYKIVSIGLIGFSLLSYSFYLYKKED